MSMEVSGSYNHSRADYAERVREKETFQRAEKAKETDMGQEEIKVPGQASEPHDVYISSEKSGARPTGMYRVEQDGNGNRKIIFEDPRKAAASEGKGGLKADGNTPGEGGKPKVDGKNPEEPEEKCVGNTDKVDREIKKLKEKKQQLEQQIRSASGDEKKVRELEKKLALVENELSQKDNDTYRRQNTVFSQ